MTTQTTPVLANGRYHIIAKLGEGGMGVVYKARDTNLDTDVVIKMPRPHALNDPEFARRFTREIRSLVKLVHPHIVKISDLGTHEGVPFAVLQYLGGGSLQDRRPRDSSGQMLPADPATLRPWLESIAEALDFVHRRGWLHRDVKPGNILFDDAGHAYLGDFGVAKVVSAGTRDGGTALTAAGVVLGTPEYMAPELIMGAPCDGRVDQYALAVTLYEVLAARPPFMGATPAAVLVNQTTLPVVSLSHINPAIPAPLADALARGLAKDPAKRYPDCASLARAVLAAVPPVTLLSWLPIDQGVTKEQSPRPEHSTPWYLAPVLAPGLPGRRSESLPLAFAGHWPGRGKAAALVAAMVGVLLLLLLLLFRWW
jgi:serine/threonine-protein kinase